MLYNIILIDDNPAMFVTIKQEWDKYGACLTNVNTVQETLGEINNKEYHLVEIAADFVKESLYPTIKTIRDATDIPIIVLTSSYNGVEKVASLRSGADEYLPLPETSEEIVMTGFAHIRRYCAFDCGRHDKKVISYRGIQLDVRERKVIISGRGVSLTRGEFECLKMLMSHPGRVFEYDLLYYGSFGEEARAEYIISSIRSLIGRVRQKVGPEFSKHIKSAHGVGYKVD